MQLMRIPAFGMPDFTLPGQICRGEESAFEGAAMRIVLIPEGCTDIGGLTQISIPESVTAIGTDVFDGCGTVFVYGTADSAAEKYCMEPEHGNCVFVEVE